MTRHVYARVHDTSLQLLFAFVTNVVTIASLTHLCTRVLFGVCVWGGGGGGRERGIGGHNVAVSTLCSRINLLCLPLVPDLRRCAPCGVFFVIIMLRIRL